VGVGIDAERHSLFFRDQTIGVGEIESDRMGIDLQETAPLSRMADDTSHIHVVGRSFIDEPTAGMGQDREIGMVHGAQDPLSLLLPGEPEVTMDRPDNKIEPAQVFIREIQGPIFQNVDLDPLQ